jgi:FtsP/CotA-like multicopper oxidase with cupredoxin domain
MTSAQRTALLVGAVILLGGGFILASGSDDGNDSTVATATTPAATTTVVTTPTPTSTNAPQAAVTPEPEPAFTTIVVRGGKPVGGVKTIKAKKGDRVRIEVSSPDTTSEVHLHGYDIKRELKAGGKVRFSFDAKLEGIFEMELEETAVPIAKIEVSPS